MSNQTKSEKNFNQIKIQECVAHQNQDILIKLNFPSSTEDDYQISG